MSLVFQLVEDHQKQQVHIVGDLIRSTVSQFIHRNFHQGLIKNKNMERSTQASLALLAAVLLMNVNIVISRPPPSSSYSYEGKGSLHFYCRYSNYYKLL